MKKNILILFIVFGCTMIMTSCYTYTTVVGKGAQSGATVTQKNHYFVYGLAQGGQSDPKAMAGGAENYTVTTQHTFIDGLINSLTFGLYTPTTTKVQK